MSKFLSRKLLVTFGAMIVAVVSEIYPEYVTNVEQMITALVSIIYIYVQGRIDVEKEKAKGDIK